jgi:hypothetical protein
MVDADQLQADITRQRGDALRRVEIQLQRESELSAYDLEAVLELGRQGR